MALEFLLWQAQKAGKKTCNYVLSSYGPSLSLFFVDSAESPTAYIDWGTNKTD